MAEKYIQPSADWQSWWEQSSRDLVVCEILFRNRLWAAACFHALQSIEMSLKALCRRPTTYGDLDGIPIVNLDGISIGTLEVGGLQRKEHGFAKLVKSLHPWHRGALDPFLQKLTRYDQDQWYLATRYPEDIQKSASEANDQWVRIPKWHVGFSETDARDLFALATEIHNVVGSRLPVTESLQSN
jgi:hypothetical protein